MWKYLLLVLLLQISEGKCFGSELHSNEKNTPDLKTIVEYLLLPMKCIGNSLNYFSNLVQDSDESNNFRMDPSFGNLEQANYNFRIDPSFGNLEQANNNFRIDASFGGLEQDNDKEEQLHHISVSDFHPWKHPTRKMVNYENLVQNDDKEEVKKEQQDQMGQTEFDPTKHPNWKLVNHPLCGEGTQSRIIGGDLAALGQYPWIARLGYKKNNGNKIIYNCGGTLINSVYVVTAGHCVTNLPKLVKLDKIRLGEFKIGTAIDCENDVCADKVQDYKPAKIILHKDFNQPTQTNDIALIKLNRRVNITQWIRPICLPYGPLMHKNYVGSMMEVAGWGITDIMFRRTSVDLMTVKVPVIDIDVCAKKYRHYTILKDKQICVGGQIGKDSCQGDSGGGLMKVDQIHSPKYYLFGVVSFGPDKCGALPYPGVYTNGRAYLQWILDNIY